MSDNGNALANIKVNKKPIKDLDSEVVTVREIISASGRDPDEVDVFQLENQGDEDGDKVALSTEFDRTEKPTKTLFFRAVPQRNVGC
ncbi:hypothetical protein [Haloarcula marina]|uniref:hypothetical protein n=1 Tax=Haloarcula marina TaxID=2961574 RepID=UPI0020B8EC3F|nr:hypothetical protein [Halomicroarcula marina]